MKKRKISLAGFEDIVVNTHSVNSDKIAEDVISIMCEALHNYFQPRTRLVDADEREEVVNIVGYYFELKEPENIFGHYDIVFDRRNNKRSDMENGKFVFETRYRQRNCLNTTIVKFLIGFS